MAVVSKVHATRCCFNEIISLDENGHLQEARLEPRPLMAAIMILKGAISQLAFVEIASAASSN